MAAAFHIIAMACGFLAMVSVVVVLATSHWLQACIPFNKFFDTVPGPGNTRLVHPLQHENLCYFVGLFQIKSSSKSFGSSTNPIDNQDIKSFILATIVLLILGAISVVLAILATFLGGMNMGIHVRIRKSLNNRTYTRIGLTLFCVSGIFLSAGMLSYTIKQAPLIHNPKLFVEHVHIHLTKSLAPITAHLSSTRNTNLVGPGNSSIAIRRLPADYDFQSGLLLVFQHSDPLFDYSFYLGWACVLATLLGTVACAVAFKRISIDQTYTDDEAIL